MMWFDIDWCNVFFYYWYVWMDCMCLFDVNCIIAIWCLFWCIIVMNLNILMYDDNV